MTRSIRWDRTYCFATLWTISWLFCISLGCQAFQAPKPNEQVSKLSVVEQGTVNQAGKPATQYEFGKVDPLKPAALEHNFTLRNEGNTPVIIERLQTSCGCTSALLPADGKKLPLTLAAGQQVSLHVALDGSHLRPGKADKFIWVYAEGSAMPAATIELIAQVLEIATFAPVVVEFGRIPAGKSRSAPIVLSLDLRLAALGKRLELVSSTPDVRVLPEFQALDPVPGKDGRVSRLYTVALAPHARLGVMNGTFSLVLRSSEQKSSGANEKTLPDSYAAAISSVFVPLTGEVVGKIAASPGTLVFGAITAGHKTTRQIIITGQNRDVLNGLKVFCATPMLTARLIDPKSVAVKPSQAHDPSREIGRGGAEETPMKILEVTAGSDIPVGTLETQIFISTQDGEQLLAPVIISIVKR